MKLALFILALSSLGLLAAPNPARSEDANHTTSGTVSVNGTNAVIAFKTVDEAVAYYKKKLEESKVDSMAAIYSSFNMTGATTESEEELAKMEAVMKQFVAGAGTLTKVDPCVGPKLGDTIQRLGYIVLYQHNFAFVDTALIHTERGWGVFSMKFDYKTDYTETLKGIPSEYYMTGRSSADKTASPEWSAFSMIEPDKEGGCKETIYLVNEHGATATFDEGITVNSGEAMRFTHHVAASKMNRLTHSFNLQDEPGGDIPVKSVILKGTVPRPDLE